MASWKKIITSGSAAELSSLTLDTALPVAQGGTGANTLTDGGVLLGSGTNAITATAVLANGELLIGDNSGDPTVGTLSATANETSIANGAGTITIGLADDVTIPASLTVTTDLTVQGGDITLTNAATDIDLKDNTASALSFDAAGKAGILEIDTTNNAEKVNMSGELVVSSNISSSAEISASAFYGDGSNLTGVSQDIDSLANHGGGGIDQDDDHFLISDAGTEKKITFNDLENAIFASMNGASSDVAVAAGGAISLENDSVGSAEIAAGSVGNSELKQNEDITLQSLTLTGDLTVNGATTVISSSNLEVKDRFILLNSGSNAGDGGIIVQHGTTASGSAYGYDVSENRWGFSKSGSLGKDAVSLTTEAFVSAVVTDDNEPEFRKDGNIRVQSGEIFIYVE
tara:strand:+ start:747 stop:1949 length:1203 start_codon:yes stop_codon:yes gene_type:complete